MRQGRTTAARLLPLAAMLALAPIPAARGAPSSTIDILPDSVVTAPSDAIEVGRVKPIDAPVRTTTRPPIGNPLWSVPLSALTVTQERPIFSASRRPPPRAIAGPQIVPVAAPSRPPPEPERSTLMLIGAVVGDDDAVAVFVDRNTQGIVRLRSGDSHGGWQLSSVLPREVTLKRADKVEVLSLRRIDGAPGPAVPSVPSTISNTMPPQVLPGVADTGGYAPFVPRSTPKNGEPDGL